MRLHPAVRFAMGRGVALSPDVLPDHPDDEDSSDFKHDEDEVFY